MTNVTAHPTRRDLLKGMASGLGAFVAATALSGKPSTIHAGDTAADDALGILIDLTRCTGCESCALACRDANQRPYTNQVPIQLDSESYSFVDECQVTNEAGETNHYHVKRQCMHCLHPGCVSACTVGALRKTAEGPVVYDADKCIGCRYCQYACPFNVPAYEWQNPLGLIHKCQMCTSGLGNKPQPACVGACPNGALRFGKRRQLLAQAHAQVLSNPGRYVDHVYGEHEIGGTSVLYLSPVPFAALGFPELNGEPIPRYAEAVMGQTPVIALGVASVVTALHLFMQRRQMVHHEITIEPTTQEPGGKL
jgi:formate dehydrogenase iron-sulfur subunit